MAAHDLSIIVRQNAMKLFLSWSGERSHAVASALAELLPDVIHNVKTWMSAHDIGAGARWGVELNAELEESNFGIICLTPENLNSPWLLFEAGSIGKRVDGSRVVPYLFGLAASDVTLPLAQFQSAEVNKYGSQKLLRALNEAQPDPLSSERLDRVFNRWWPDLNERLSAIPDVPADTAVPDVRSDRAILAEILDLVRAEKMPAKPRQPTSSSDITKVLQEAIEYHDGRINYMIKRYREIAAKGETPSGMYEDYAEESQWMLGKLKAAIRAFEEETEWPHGRVNGPSSAE